MTPADTEPLAALGPFFAVATHLPGAAPELPWAAMNGITQQRHVLDERVAAVRRTLAAGTGRPPGDVPLRVAASVVHLGLVSRVLSPYLALTVLHGAAPRVPELAALHWQPHLGGPYPLSLPLPPPSAHPAPAPAALAAGLLDEGRPVRELTAACARSGVPQRVLWGNVSSAVHGAAAMVGRARPELAAAARDLAAVLLASPALYGTGHYTARGAFRRLSCCLIYQAAAAPRGVSRRTGALCGDCVMRRPA